MEILKDFGNGALKVRLNDGLVNYIRQSEYTKYEAMTKEDTEKHFKLLKHQAEHKARMASAGTV